MLGGGERTVWHFEARGNLLDYQKKAKSGFDQMDKSVDKFEGRYKRSAEKNTRQTKKWKNSLTELGHEFPLIGRGLTALKSPLGIAAVGIGGVTVALNKATKEAKKFDNTFLELKNLNMDKTKGELEDLRQSVLDVAFDKALDPNKTSKAFFDVQSATGKYGKEVEVLVGRIGEFSRSVKADFNTSIEGASKAIDTFGIKGSDIDKFLESSAKTVQVGVTTFDQLAQVQTEFSGAAASAGQSYDEANKLFAMFTKTSKNVDIAATMTKGTFEDLSKLENIGIKVFGSDGQWRKLDKIVEDVNKKFSSMADADIDKLIKKVGGNEGLRGMLKNVQTQGDKVLDTFKAFDNTQFSVGDAISNANADLSVMEEKLNNQITNAWIRLGDAVKPFMITMKQGMLDLINKAVELGNVLSKAINPEGWAKNEAMAKAESNAMNFRRNIRNELYGISFTDVLTGQDKEKRAKGIDQSQIDNVYQREKGKLEKLKAQLEIERIYNEDAQKSAVFEKSDLALGPFAIANMVRKGIGNNDTADVIKGYEEQIQSIDMKLKVLSDLKFKGGAALFDPEKTGAKSDIKKVHLGLADQDKKKKEHIAGIMSSTERVRNVRVNITNLVKELNINSQTINESTTQLQGKIAETIIRAVRNAELTLSQG